MATANIVLYDIPSKGRCHCWSPNPWKTRLALSFKGLPYDTEFVEYPDIAHKLSSFGISPNGEGMKYTIPAVKFPDGKYIMDSMAIAQELEKRYPSPSLRLDSPKLARLPDILGPISEALRPVWMPNVANNLLNQPSYEYFYRTRTEMVSQDLDEYAREKGGEQCWEKAEPLLDSLSAFVAENTAGVYVEGETVSYADFVIVAFLNFYKRVDEEKLFNRVVKGRKPLSDLFEACQHHFSRDD